MCTNNWPLLLDLSRDECKRILRRLELEAYSAVLTAFRAQGDLSKDKKGILQDLQNILSISTERHRAEVRRAVNDEKLTTIADNMAGPDISSEWQIEGRRLIPLMPRLVPQTAFTVTANNAANMQAEKNMSLPPPSQTGSKEVVPTTPTTPSSSAPATAAPRPSRPTSPASNVVVLPSGMSIHIKGGLNTEEEDIQSKRRRRSSSAEGPVITKSTHTPVSTVVATKPTVAPPGPGTTSVSPMKITFTKSPAKQQTTNVTQSQKVILVSTTTHSGSTPTIIQKSMPVPVIKTTTTTGGTVTTFTSPRASIIMPSSMASSVANGNLGSIVTVATTSSIGAPRSSTTAMTALTTANPTILASSLNTVRPRTKMITTRPKTPMVSPRTGMVMQMGGSHVAGSPMVHASQGLHNIQVKPVHNKPTIHIKHEGGMKIITQGMPAAGSKILPKPPGSAQGSPMVVMSSAQPSITMVSKSNASLAGQMAGGRVLNITTQGGKVIASSSNRGTAANVVTVNPKTLQLTAIKGAGGTTVLTTSGRVATATGAKPNVIVVQKAQPKRCPTSTTPTITFPRPSTSTANSSFEKELVSYIHKQDSLKHLQTQKTIVTKQVMAKSGTEGQIKRQQQPVAVKVRSDSGGGGESGRSSLLAELIQAVGIQPDSSGGVTTTTSASTPAVVSSDPAGVHTVVVQQEEVVMTTNQSGVTGPGTTTSKEVGHRWVEYDVPRGGQTLLPAGRDSSDTSAIKALLDLQTGAKHQPRQKIISNADLSQIRIQQQERYPIEKNVATPRAAATSTTQSTTCPIQFNQTIKPQAAEAMTTNVVLEQPDGETVAVQLAGADLAHLTSMGQEIIGELDPETGIFYTTAPGGGETSIAQQSTVTQQIIPPPSASAVKGTTVTTTSPASKPIDFLSSALTQAQIDLDPYQFIEEDEPAFSTKMQTESDEPPSQHSTQESLMQILTPDSSTSVTTEQNIPSQDLNLKVNTGSPVVAMDACSVPSGVPETPEVIEQVVTLSLETQPPSDATQLAAQSERRHHPTPQTAPSQSQLLKLEQIRPSQPVLDVLPKNVGVLHTGPAAQSTNPAITTELESQSCVSTQQVARPVQSTDGTSSIVCPEREFQSVVSTVQMSRLGAAGHIVPRVSQSAISATQSTNSDVSSTVTTLSVPTADRVNPEITTVTPPPVVMPTASMLVPSCDDLPTSTTEGTTLAQEPAIENQGGEILEEMVVSDGIIDFAQHEVCVPETASNVTVAVQPGGLDTTTMVIEDFASQQLITDNTVVTSAIPPQDLVSVEYAMQGDASQMSEQAPLSPTPGVSGTSEGQTSSGGESGDPGVHSPVRSSQRKRRPPSMPDDSPPHGHGNMSSWVRHASSLLQKVCKYRGLRKEKGEQNASAWFLAPVDPKEVPDYYDIIKKPMDFGTVRHKLETSQYNGWEDFHIDMMLVQENCQRYNPPGHEIRKDCEEVFAFYVHEYEHCKDRWNKMHLNSPSSKKPRMDRSPMRT